MTAVHTPSPKKRSLGERFFRALVRDKWLYLIMLLPAAYYLVFC